MDFRPQSYWDMYLSKKESFYCLVKDLFRAFNRTTEMIFGTRIKAYCNCTLCGKGNFLDEVTVKSKVLLTRNNFGLICEPIIFTPRRLSLTKIKTHWCEVLVDNETPVCPYCTMGIMRVHVVSVRQELDPVALNLFYDTAETLF